MNEKSNTDPASSQPETTPKIRLWNFNFFLLWQGQLVSAMGDVIYAIALGFWILAVTGVNGVKSSHYT
jgi:DHA3 family macrolide efflux protein-like MFS transporter